MLVGVLSDTHGLLRPRVVELLRGCDRLLHAGDVGDDRLLAELRELAPLAAVRGNVDTDGECGRLPLTLAGELDGLPFRMVHRQEEVGSDWPSKVRLIVYGHSHRPELSWRGQCLLLNPGACGRRRFHLPLTVAMVEVRENRLIPRLLPVE